MLNFLSTLLSPIFTPMGVSQADLTAYLNQLSGYVYAILFVIIAMIALMIGAHWAKKGTRHIIRWVAGLGALAADSHLDVTRSLMFQSNPCDLGGNTLFVNIASGKSWHIRETSFANGRVETGTTGWLHIVSATDASTVDFKVNSALQIDAQFDVAATSRSGRTQLPTRARPR